MAPGPYQTLVPIYSNVPGQFLIEVAIEGEFLPKLETETPPKKE
jgi:hypothetical protein